MNTYWRHLAESRAERIAELEDSNGILIEHRDQLAERIAELEEALEKIANGEYKLKHAEDFAQAAKFIAREALAATTKTREAPLERSSEPEEEA